MNSRNFWRKPQTIAIAMILLVGLAGLGMARAGQKHLFPSLNASLKLADPAEGPSGTGFAPVVKGVLPDVVNISTSKVVRASDQFSGSEEMPPFFQQFFVLTGSSCNCDALTHSYVSSPVSENDLRAAEPVSFKQSVRTIAHATPKRRGAKAIW